MLANSGAKKSGSTEQFSAANHITDNQKVTMVTYCNKNASNGEQRKHLLSRFWSCTMPAFNTYIGDLLHFIMLCNVQPSNIIIISIQIKG
jgi:hypothetical protein